jgi:hypothetical protein
MMGASPYSGSSPEAELVPGRSPHRQTRTCQPCRQVRGRKDHPLCALLSVEDLFVDGTPNGGSRASHLGSASPSVT